MKLTERLDAALTWAGLSEGDRMLWRGTIEVMPFNKQEIFVALLEASGKDDIVFFNHNLKEKIGVMKAMDVDAMRAIIESEKTYLSLD
jgi:hypothetical protein